MPPKSKSKTKESPEQRRVRLEMEAVAAAELESARQAAATTQLREAAAREAAMTAVNSRQLNTEWLQRMRGAKLGELQIEARALAQQHTAAVERRDRLAEALLRDVAAQDVQHDAAATAHGRVLDELVGLHTGRLEALHSQFEGDLQAVQAEFESERAEMVSLHHRTKKELSDILAALAQSYADTRAEAAASYRLQEEEVRSRASEVYNVTKLSLEARVRDLEGQVEQQHKSYQEGTGEQNDAYRSLAAADDQAAGAVDQRTEKLRGMQQALVQWRGRIVTNSSEWLRRNTALAREKEVVLGHHTALKAALAKFRTAQEARLKHMCANSAAVEAGLRAHLATAQRIIKVATLCRKHELPDEGAGADEETASSTGELPAEAAGGAALQQEGDEALGGTKGAHVQHHDCDGGSTRGSSSSSSGSASSSSSSEAQQALQQGGSTLADLGLQPESSGQRLLDAFVRRMNKAVLNSACLEQERLRLTAENAALHAAVRAVQEGTTLGPAAVEGPLSTLLIVNERLQKQLGAAPAQQRLFRSAHSVGR